MSDALLHEKWRIFSMPLTDAELSQISTCRRGIFGAVVAGSGFGVFCGRMALGPGNANFLVKALVIGTSTIAGALVGSGLALQQSFNYLKAQPTHLAEELKKYSTLKRELAKKTTETDDEFNKIFNKRAQKLPPKEKS